MKCKRCGDEEIYAWGCCLGCLGEIVAEWEERQDEPIEFDPVYTDLQTRVSINETEGGPIEMATKKAPAKSGKSAKKK